MRFLYWGAGVFVGYEINKIFNLNEKQKRDSERKIKSFLDWHKRDRLPTYANLLKEINQGFASYPLKQEIIKENIQKARKILDQEQVILAKKLIPLTKDFFLTLNDKQINRLDKKINGFSEAREKEYNSTKAEYDEERAKRTIETANFFGIELDEQQKKAIAIKSNALLDNRRYWKDFYDFQRKALITNLRKKNQVAIEKTLEKLLIYKVGNFSEDYYEDFYAQREKGQNFALEIFELLSEEQVEELYQKINTYINKITKYTKSLK